MRLPHLSADATVQGVTSTVSHRTVHKTSAMTCNRKFKEWRTSRFVRDCVIPALEPSTQLEVHPLVKRLLSGADLNLSPSYNKPR